MPKGFIRLMNASTLSVVPVISNTKLWSVESTGRARKTSAMRSASMRCSPIPSTFTNANSRSTCGPYVVKSRTFLTGTIWLNCAFICSITAGVPLETTVMRDVLCSWSVSATVKLSIL